MKGGAVELSWKLRPASGSTDNFVECDGGGTILDTQGQRIVGPGLLTQIRLRWQVGETAAAQDFACARGHGVTGFDLPPTSSSTGPALISIIPLCSGGEAAPRTYTTPAAEQRQVIAGNTISLGAVEVVLEVSRCDGTVPVGTSQPCICQ